MTRSRHHSHKKPKSRGTYGAPRAEHPPSDVVKVEGAVYTYATAAAESWIELEGRQPSGCSQQLHIELEREIARWQDEALQQYSAGKGRAHEVALLDIAKPGKARGHAKEREYELVQRMPFVIALDDEQIGWDVAGDEEDGWEEIYVPQTAHKPRPTYSSVLRGND